MESTLGFAPRHGSAAAAAPLAVAVLWPSGRVAITLAQVTRRFRFGPYLIDLAARELSDDSRLMRLSPRVFDCVAYLIEHRERAVGRDELIAAVWGRVDIADTQLAQVILKMRRAVGDSGEAQHTIRTVVGFGYRWVAGVVDDADYSAQLGVAATLLPMPRGEEPASQPALEFATEIAVASAKITPSRFAASSRLRSLPVFVLLATLLLAMVASAIWRGTRDKHSAADTSAVGAARMSVSSGVARNHTIAVLPAEVDASAEWSWLRLGIMEFVAGCLRNAGQSVVPSENVVSLMGAAIDPAALPSSVRIALDPYWIVVTSVRKTDSGWVARLELRARGADTREFSAHADDPIAAARMASYRLLGALGHAMPDDGGAARRPAEEWMSRIDAALVVDDLDVARRQLRGAPAELRATPELRLRHAEIDLAAGHNDVAASALGQLRADVPAETDPVQHARIVSLLAAVHVRLGRVTEAEKDARDALTLLEGRGEPALLGKTFMRRGVARTLQGHHDEALADFAQARIAMQLAGDMLGVAQVELNEGALNGVRNHPADALASFKSAEKNFERFGVSSELANALANQVVAHRVLLQPEAALDVSGRSLALLGRLASPESAHLIRLRRAQALADVGRWSEATAQLDELSRAIEPAREIELAAMTANERARLELARMQPAHALALAEPVAGLAEAAFASTRAEAWFIEIRALRALGRMLDAAAATKHFSAWTDATGNTTFAIHAKLTEAEQAFGEGRHADADRLYERSLSEANRQNVPADIADVAISYGNALIARGALMQAAPVVGQLDRFAAHNFDTAVLQARLYHALGQTEAWRRALDSARALAGERPLPPDLTSPPEAASVARPTAVTNRALLKRRGRDRDVALEPQASRVMGPCSTSAKRSRHVGCCNRRQRG